MTADEFRRLAARAIDLVGSYLRDVDRLPVMPPTTPGAVMSQLPEHAAESPGGEAGWEHLFVQLRELVIPNLLHWQSPHFYGYFPCNTSPPAILAEIVCAGLGVQGMLWQTAPAANEIERALLDQMARALRLPERFLSTGETGGGCIQPTASDSTLVAMVAARRRVLDRTGAEPGSLCVYASAQAHSSVLKAAMIAGIARDTDDRSRVRLIPTDAEDRLDSDALRHAIRRDTDRGLAPCFVCGTVGTTGTTAVDPVGRIAEVLRETGTTRLGTWLHVDAAHAGVLLLCPEFAWLGEGLEHADSLCVNPHKWLLTTFDCDLFWTADRRSLVSSLSVTPEYLRNDASETGEVFDYRDWGVPLGRRFRALKLWFVLTHYGLEGLRSYLREHVRLAAMLESLLAGDERFELLAPRTMNLVCFGLRAGDDASADLLRAINGSGRAFVTHTTVEREGATRYAIRVAVGASSTREEHVRALWGLLSEQADAVLGSRR